NKSCDSFLLKLNTALNNLGEKKYDLLKSFDIVNYDPEAEKTKLWAKSFNDSLNNGTIAPISLCSLTQFIPEDAWFYSITKGAVKLILDRKDGHLDLFYGLWKQPTKTKESLQEATIHLLKTANNEELIYPYWEAGMFASDFLECIYKFAKQQLSDEKILINFAKEYLRTYTTTIKSHLMKKATKQEFDKAKENGAFIKNLQEKYSSQENQTFENLYIFHLYDFASTVNSHMQFGMYNPSQKKRSESEMTEDMQEGFELVSNLTTQLGNEFTEHPEICEIVEKRNFMSLVKINKDVIEQDESKGSAYLWKSEFGFE
ncbi:MAG TPA: hypothetical protein VI959_05280, partial [Alphaproteobacteria bacterium]|nr:hypothetical protein [Alphaproteobacteria bacterium]